MPTEMGLNPELKINFCSILPTYHTTVTCQSNVMGHFSQKPEKKGVRIYTGELKNICVKKFLHNGDKQWFKEWKNSIAMCFTLLPVVNESIHNILLGLIWAILSMNSYHGNPQLGWTEIIQY